MNPNDYQALVLPGGFYSYGFDEAFDQKVHRLAEAIHRNGGYIATMCVGILPIADAGLLNGKEATTYPYSRNHDNIGRFCEQFLNRLAEPAIKKDLYSTLNPKGSRVFPISIP